MEKYTFETLVVGEFNEFAHSVAVKNIQGGVTFNPILLQAKTGLGKTHILQAILNEAKEKKSTGNSNIYNM